MPRAIFASVIKSLTATMCVPPQSPTHTLAVDGRTALAARALTAADGGGTGAVCALCQSMRNGDRGGAGSVTALPQQRLPATPTRLAEPETNALSWQPHRWYPRQCGRIATACAYTSPLIIPPPPSRGAQQRQEHQSSKGNDEACAELHRFAVPAGSRLGILRAGELPATDGHSTGRGFQNLRAPPGGDHGAMVR